jgi:hypothetical protein
MLVRDCWDLSRAAVGAGESGRRVTREGTTSDAELALEVAPLTGVKKSIRAEMQESSQFQDVNRLDGW